MNKIKSIEVWIQPVINHIYIRRVGKTKGKMYFSPTPASIKRCQRAQIKLLEAQS